MTQSKKPPMQSSEEANKDQLELAKAQGEAYMKALKHMAQKEADVGGEKPAGQYIVAYAIEKAEGMYHLKDGKLEWMKPNKENAHIEVSVRDAADNRFIPGLNVHVTLLDHKGNEIGSHRQEFLWHPWLYHYGRNWEIPEDGTYDLKVRIDPPEFMRHDPINGQRYAHTVELEFRNVEIKTGQK